MMSQYVSIFIAVLVLILCGLMYFGYRQINKIQMENNQIKYDMEALKKIQRDMDSHYKMAIDMAISQHLTNNQKVNSRKEEEEEFADEEDDYETEEFVEEEEISAQEESDDDSEEDVQEDSEEEVDEEILNALEESDNNEDQEEETQSVEQNEESENQEEQNVEELEEEETNNEEEETNNEEKTEEDRLVETVNKIQEQIESRNRRKGSAPATPAKEYQEGTVLENEGKKYVVSANKNGSKRWKLLQ